MGETANILWDDKAHKLLSEDSWGEDGDVEVEEGEAEGENLAT